MQTNQGSQIEWRLFSKATAEQSLAVCCTSVETSQFALQLNLLSDFKTLEPRGGESHMWFNRPFTHTIEAAITVMHRDHAAPEGGCLQDLYVSPATGPKQRTTPFVWLLPTVHLLSAASNIRRALLVDSPFVCRATTLAVHGNPWPGRKFLSR